ncbi:hypothetical protein [Urbifossiella limnaea]|uniref:YncE family protein n=1 Tax=Urbifossiella limnaea TaxID=2528023 RepID=A0A517XYZ5_9BACT|nr:hypothetical protein [Urbifossiella limnaea]QDU22722.1 hypothetical protein ETAA1_47080 [Urbifossiella limnaea]
MRSALLTAAVVAAVAATAAAQSSAAEVKSVSALAFGPDGVLFVGDPAGAAVHAVPTGDTKADGAAAVDIERVDAKIAGVLGTTEKDIRINDFKVNPASGNVYVAVTRGAGAGTPAVVRITRAGKVESVSLKNAKATSVTLPNPAQGKGAATVITSMSFVNGKLIVAGLSNEQFASTLRVIPYPFAAADKGAGIEIFHGAHNKIETHAPIRTFVPYKVNGEDNIMAAYTCTPLVKVPLADLKAGAKVKGTTIAELGNGNSPLDMIVYAKGGKDYLLMANNKRGVMKIPTEGFGSATAITAKLDRIPSGVPYTTVSELKDVLHLDKLDADRALLLVKNGDGADLKTVPLP